jgi:hypothetical protein
MTLAHLDANFTVLDGIGDVRAIFAFEADFAHDLRCIPMVVRFKLDRCGVKLSLRQWSKMGMANRASLLASRCDTGAEIEAYRIAVVHLAKTHCPEAIKWLPLDPEPAWANASRVPAEIIRQATDSGVAPPSPQCWSELSTLQRFALLKLARSDHDNHNFVPAMREMQLIAD